MTHEVVVYGLGKMGWGVARQLNQKGIRVVAYNRTKDKVDKAVAEGMIGATSHQDIFKNIISKPRVIWLMLPAGEIIDNVLFGADGLISYLNKGDFIIDAGNSFYKDDIKRHLKVQEKNISYIDVGVSGGPSGALNGACLMVGGDKDSFKYLSHIYEAVARPNGVSFCEGVGAGHFAKMVHNGIEYGMMQAIGEGFEVLRKSKFNFDLEEVARIYNTGSVIESRLIGWLQSAYKQNGQSLSDISGKVSHSGEGKWTVETAKELNIDVPVIEASLDFRVASQKNPSYTGQVVSALRGQFGGHKVDNDKKQ